MVPLVLVGQSSLSHFSQTFGLTVWPFQQQNIRILAFLVELVEKGRGRLLLFYWNIVDLQGILVSDVHQSDSVFYFYFLAMPCGFWDFSFPTRG